MAKRYTKYDTHGAPKNIVRGNTKYRHWDEYMSKSEANNALRFARKHGRKGFIKSYKSIQHNDVHVLYTT